VIATDNTSGGAAAADALAKLIGEKGEVMAIAFQAGASTSDQRLYANLLIQIGVVFPT
jgi:ribose transport system substrate-binding protein